MSLDEMNRVTPMTTVVLKQLSTLWRSGSVWMLLGVCVALAIYTRRQLSLDLIARTGQDYSWFGTVYNLLSYLTILGAIWPLVVWRGEAWGERDYRWSLPVSRHTHDLMRVAAGALWLVLGVAVCISAIRISHDLIVPEFPLILVDPSGLPAGTNVSALAGKQSLPAAEYLNFFTAPLLSYIIVSILALSARRPLSTAVMIVIAIATWSSIGQMFKNRWMTDALEWPMRGLYGLYTALDGLVFDVTRVRVPMHSEFVPTTQFVQIGIGEWFITYALWISMACALLFIASRRRA